MLVPCPGCARHLRTHESRCPFCASPVVAIALATALALAACNKSDPRGEVAVYGGPPPRPVATDAGTNTPDAPIGPPAPPASDAGDR